MSVSVIVTTRNEENNIERCLRSIKQQTYKDIELIVVDNNSTDETKRVARKYTNHVYNLGPERSAQRNFGIQKARGTYVLVVDADMALFSDVIATCVKHSKGNDALVIPEDYSGEGFWTKCKILEKRSYRWTGEGEAARFFKKKVLLALNGYDESLAGPEDVDLQKRLLHAGYRVDYAPTWIVHHEGRLTLPSIIRKRWYYSKNLQRYLAKNREESKREFTFLRPAFFKNWKLFLRDPLHTAGFLVMRFFEGLAVLYALIRKSN